jgi:hypothetical protein
MKISKAIELGSHTADLSVNEIRDLCAIFGFTLRLDEDRQIVLATGVYDPILREGEEHERSHNRSDI